MNVNLYNDFIIIFIKIIFFNFYYYLLNLFIIDILNTRFNLIAKIL